MMEKDFKKLEKELKKLLRQMDKDLVGLLMQEARAVSFDCPGFTLLGLIQRAAKSALDEE